MNESLDQVLTFIHQADDTQINEIIQAVVKRYARVFPDWEVIFLSLPRNNPAKRREMIQSALDFFNK